MNGKIFLRTNFAQKTKTLYSNGSLYQHWPKWPKFCRWYFQMHENHWLFDLKFTKFVTKGKIGEQSSLVCLDNGLVLNRRQATIWTMDKRLSLMPCGITRPPLTKYSKPKIYNTTTEFQWHWSLSSYTNLQWYYLFWTNLIFNAVFKALEYFNYFNFCWLGLCLHKMSYEIL